jgi:hypothetical protein
MKKRRWMIRAGWILGILILIWAAAAVVLNTASAEGLPFSLRLRSRLSADYSVDKSGPLKALNFSIIGDLLRDLGLTDDEAEAGEVSVRLALNDPVPTATARNFAGDPPFTATPTRTSIPTETPEPSATATRTPLPTKPPTVTQTPSPVKTATAVPLTDHQYPFVKDPGTISPSIGPVSCSVNVSVSDVVIQDPGPSSGIAWAKLKYKVYNEDFSSHFNSYVYSSPLQLCWTNNLPGGVVEACYSGPTPAFQVQIFPGFAGPSDYTGTHFNVKVWVLTQDNVGKQASYEYGSYVMPASCDDPTATDTPTPTTSPTVTPTATSTITPTPTSSPTP